MAVAIVTGGNTGIGRATALALADSGFDIGITWERDEQRAESAAREIRDAGARCEVSYLDLHDLHEVPGVVEDLSGALGGVDVLVNNAGYATGKPFLDVTLDDWRGILEVNLTGAFLTAQAAARRMVEQARGGVIINVTSVHEHIPLSRNAPYTASKHGLGGLTKAMALELGEHGIRVNSVAPGQIATRLSGQEDRPPSAIPVPLGRAGDGGEVGVLIAWLASEQASYVTGASYVVDGGLMLLAAEHQ